MGEEIEAERKIYMDRYAVEKILDALLQKNVYTSELTKEEVAILSMILTYEEFLEKRIEKDHISVEEILFENFTKLKIPLERKRVKEILISITGIADIEKSKKKSILEKLFGRKKE